MTAVKVYRVDPACEPDHVGAIPSFLDLDDPRPAREQFHERYLGIGGGWRPQSGFTNGDPEPEVTKPYRLHYPGDPPMDPLAAIPFRKEMIMIYRFGYVAIWQQDGTFEMCRMD